MLDAVQTAEQAANETLTNLWVNLPGGQPSSRAFTAEVPVSGREIGDSDVAAVLDQGRRAPQPPDRTAIHSIPMGFSIDGSRGIRDPRGMFGQRLGVNMHVVTASTSALRTLKTAVNRCHLDIQGVVAGAYAAGMSVLVDDERDLGVTLIDMGGGSTSIAVFHEGHLAFTDSVPIGGQHVTSDIARGLSTPVAHAERIKALYGAALASTDDERELIDVPLVGEDDMRHANHVERSILTGIIQPRLEETFELVRSRLEGSGLERLSGRRVVLTGQPAGRRARSSRPCAGQASPGGPPHPPRRSAGFDRRPRLRHRRRIAGLRRAARPRTPETLGGLQPAAVRPVWPGRSLAEREFLMRTHNILLILSQPTPTSGG
jgi:cell division protein FtsA